MSVPFRTDYPHCGDYEWLLRVVRRVPLVYYERPLTDIRLHPKQASAKNLRIGQDVEESYKIIKDNLFIHGKDLPTWSTFSICWHRSKLISRRIPSALLKGQFLLSVKRALYASRFLMLIYNGTRERLTSNCRFWLL